MPYICDDSRRATTAEEAGIIGLRAVRLATRPKPIKAPQSSSHSYRNVIPELAIALPAHGLSDKPLDAAYGYQLFADTLDAFPDAPGLREFIADPNPTEANVAACSGLIVVDEAGGAALAKLLPNRPDVGRRRSVHGEEEA